MTAEQPDREFLKSVPGRDPIIIEGLLRAAPDRVFRAFTDPRDVCCWFIPKAGSLEEVEIDLQVGGSLNPAPTPAPSCHARQARTGVSSQRCRRRRCHRRGSPRNGRDRRERKRHHRLDDAR